MQKENGSKSIYVFLKCHIDAVGPCVLSVFVPYVNNVFSDCIHVFYMEILLYVSLHDLFISPEAIK